MAKIEAFSLEAEGGSDTQPGFLNRMQCPYCGGSLQLKASYEEKGGAVISGLVTCPCSRYPILEGILVLRPPIDRGYLANLVENGHLEKAIWLLMSRRDPQLLRFVASASRGSRLRRLLLAPFAEYLMAEGSWQYAKARRDVSFFRILGDIPFESYLKHRFSAETLWMVYGVVPLLRDKDRVILDLGCGAGHASYILNSYCRPRELICADPSFLELYLARKYMVPEATFIQLDANFPLPFRDDMIDCVLSVDALHYVEAKLTLAEQLKRILHPEGTLVLLHLHNAMHQNRSPGFPLAPSAWLDLFQDFSLRVIADRRIVEGLTIRDQLDLRQSSLTDELSAANAISIIASNDSSLFSLYGRVREHQFSISRNLRLNPIYRKTRGRGGSAIRVLPTDSFATEYPLSAAHLPERTPFSHSIEGDPSRLSMADRGTALEMFKRFVLIDLPPEYLGTSTGGSKPA